MWKLVESKDAIDKTKRETMIITIDSVKYICEDLDINIYEI